MLLRKLPCKVSWIILLSAENVLVLPITNLDCDSHELRLLVVLLCLRIILFEFFLLFIAKTLAKLSCLVWFLGVRVHIEIGIFITLHCIYHR